jgi:hypothetical protein
VPTEAIGDINAAVMILAVVVINALLGFSQGRSSAPSCRQTNQPKVARAIIGVINAARRCISPLSDRSLRDTGARFIPSGYECIDWRFCTKSL